MQDKLQNAIEPSLFLLNIILAGYSVINAEKPRQEIVYGIEPEKWTVKKPLCICECMAACVLRIILRLPFG